MIAQPNIEDYGLAESISNESSQPDQPTEITVESVRDDIFGNRWVTPSGGGKEIKLGEKRSQLHELFKQGNKITLRWDSFNNNPYVKDAKLVSGVVVSKSKVRLEGAEVKPATFDVRTRDIHNQVAYKIAGEIVAAEIQAGRFTVDWNVSKGPVTEIAVRISSLAKNILTMMENLQ